MEIQANRTNGFDPSAMRSRIADQMFRKADVNGDNGIDMSEFEAGMTKMGNGQDAEQMFGKIDTNGDGKIDKTESEDVLKKVGEKMKSRLGKISLNFSISGNTSSNSIDSLLAALQTSDSDNEQDSGNDESDSRISRLVSDLQSAAKYGQTGSFNFPAGGMNSTFSLIA
jgi:hypothetical protein